jgi:hypothetical protein
MTSIHPINKIHQVLIVDGYVLPEKLPPLIQTDIESAKLIYPQAVHKLWNGTELRAFIRYHLGADALWAFDYLHPYSYKCDLARFCLLYVEGGIYIDLGVRLMNSWPISVEYGIGAFRDVRFCAPSWSTMQTGLLGSKPGRPELKQAIEWIVENCRNLFYGENPLYPTGPVLLGRAFISAMAKKGNTEEADDQCVGECRCVTPEAEMLNVSYISREGTLVGLRTKVISGDIAHLGLSGSNNYNQLWKSRQVYGEQERVWNFDDKLIELENGARRNDSGIVIPLRTTGRITCGPYVDLPEGTYQLTIDFAARTKFSRLLVDIIAGESEKTVHTIEHKVKCQEPHQTLCVEFAFDYAPTEVQFGISVFGDFSGEIRRFRLTQLPYRIWTFRHKRIEFAGAYRTANGITIPKGHSGRVIYGPYTDIEPGSYCLKIAFSPNTCFARLLVEVCVETGTKIIHAFEYQQKERSIKPEIEVFLEIQSPLTDVEFRLEVFGDFEGEFRSFTLFERPSTRLSRRPFLRRLLAPLNVED